MASIGQLYFLGNYTQGPNGSLTFDIAGTTPGEYELTNSTSAVTPSSMG